MNTHEQLIPQSVSGLDQAVPGVLDNAVALAAQAIHISIEELLLWLDYFPKVPAITKLHLLHLIKCYGLDPLNQELIFIQQSPEQWQTLVTMDGWSRIMNQHPAFCGISFKESDQLIDDIPRWMECCIYREDRVLPIAVKEYYEEVKTEHVIWKEMPRRMLRHRVIQQCARLAFGISLPEFSSIILKQSNEPVSQDKQSRQGDIPAGNESLMPESHTKKLKKHLLQSI